MVPPEFFFALAVSGGASREMLQDLVAHVLERAGGPDHGLATLGEELHAAVSSGARGQTVDVQFSAAAGRLLIVVSSEGGAIWQASRDLE